MTEEKKQHEIWTPKEKLDANVQRMAWLMFIEWWKEAINKLNWKEVNARTTEAYQNCLKAAKIVRECEVDAGSA